ncbi:MAG: hypothetical protein GY762_08555 [Proteobacteria bacterium]|nr:hypothetical protein [Pseudomonadota bacterium]
MQLVASGDKASLDILHHMKKLFTYKTLIRSVALTVLFEGITVLCRFGLNLESTRDTASTIGVITAGMRIHHGYVGLLLAGIAFWSLKTKPDIARWVLAIGVAFVCSDVIHHFGVLWFLTGSPAFDLFYPRS